VLDAGIVASGKRIANLMREAHLYGVSRRRGYTVTTQRNSKERSAPALVKRQFIGTDINHGS
jgi:putative transposase